MKRSNKAYQLLAHTGNILAATSAFLSGKENQAASYLLLTSFLLASYCYVQMIQRKGVSPLSFSAFLFYSYGFVLPGLFVTRTDHFYWPSSALTPENIVAASLVTFLSTIAFCLGRFSSIKVTKATAPLKPNQEITLSALKKKQRLSLLLVTAIASAYILLSLSLYGLQLFWGTRASIGSYSNAIGLNSTTVGIFKMACQALALSCFTLTAYCRFCLGDKSSIVQISLLTAIILILLVNNPLFTPRYWMIATFTVAAVTIFNQTFQKHKGAIYFFSPIFMFLLFPFLGSFNRRGEGINFDFTFKSPTELMTHGDLDGFQSITNIVHLVSEQGLALGGRLLSAILFFVPRTNWQGKHISTGSDAAEAASYEFTRISMPLAGEFYADGGYTLVIFGMFIVGGAVKKLDNTYNNLASRTNTLKVLICIIFAGFAPILLRGSLLSVISGVIVSCCFFLAWDRLSKLNFKSNL